MSSWCQSFSLTSENAIFLTQYGKGYLSMEPILLSMSKLQDSPTNKATHYSIGNPFSSFWNSIHWHCWAFTFNSCNSRIIYNISISLDLHWSKYKMDRNYSYTKHQCKISFLPFLTMDFKIWWTITCYHR